MGPLVALSTASVYPQSAAHGFELAASLGYDALEVMVTVDPITQEIEAVRHLAAYHEVRVCAIHAPTLLFTQHVWGTEPWGKLQRSAEMAHAVGADVVVVHPPFRWQREYAAGFAEGIAELEDATGLAFAVENMYPWRASRRKVQAYLPHWDLLGQGYTHTTLDVSHAATSHQSSLDLARALGPSLRHVHLSDGTGSAKDEHLIPSRGTQPVAELLGYLRDISFEGHVVLEVNTRKCSTRRERESELAEALAFAREHLEGAEHRTAARKASEGA
jgi:sugar phosphate isomerase/epimerase